MVLYIKRYVYKKKKKKMVRNRDFNNHPIYFSISVFMVFHVNQWNTIKTGNERIYGPASVGVKVFNKKPEFSPRRTGGIFSNSAGRLLFLQIVSFLTSTKYHSYLQVLLILIIPKIQTTSYRILINSTVYK